MEYAKMEYKKNRLNSMDNKVKMPEDNPGVLIYLDMEGKSKEELFMNLALFAKEKGLTHDEAAIYKELNNYEKAKGTTATGQQIALPTAYSQDITRPFAFILCRARNPVDFDSSNGKSVRILLVSLIKDKNDPKLLKATAQIARLLRKEDFRTAFLRVKNKEEIQSLLSTSEKENEA